MEGSPTVSNSAKVGLYGSENVAIFIVTKNMLLFYIAHVKIGAAKYFVTYKE
jgi:hypothetical protein